MLLMAVVGRMFSSIGPDQEVAYAKTEAPKKPAKKARKAAAGQKEMLMPIAGKTPAKEAAAKRPAAKPQRKSA
jgi:DNA end-binding protein Ku